MNNATLAAIFYFFGIVAFICYILVTCGAHLSGILN